METNLNTRIDFLSRAARRPLREVSVTSLLQVDMLAPQQYQQAMRGKLCQPEQELMLAVLKDAICCFQGCPSTRDKMRTRLYLEARKWLMEEDSDWPFSFANICDAFGLSPQHLRAGLLRRQETTLATVTKAIHSGPTGTKARHRNRNIKRLPPNDHYKTFNGACMSG